MKLGAERVGRSLVYGLYPGTPCENVRAVMDAMQKYSLHYSRSCPCEPDAVERGGLDLAPKADYCTSLSAATHH